MPDQVDSCEYCVEMRDPERSRFREIYGPRLRSRIVQQTSRFVVMPTIGQVLPGSMLVIPREHVETLASTGRPIITELVSLSESVFDPAVGTIMFEHGARSMTAGGCGIYHAHLHIVPVPSVIAASDLLPAGVAVDDLEYGLSRIETATEYLIVRDTLGETRLLDLTGVSNHAYPSQYFRRCLVQHFGLEEEWDWRKYTEPEPRLLDTVSAFHGRVAGQLVAL